MATLHRYMLILSHSLHLPELPALTLEVQMDTCYHLSWKYIISNLMLLLSCDDTSNISPTFPFCSKRRKETLQSQRVDKWKPKCLSCGGLESGSAGCACIHSLRGLVQQTCCQTRTGTSSSTWTAALRCPTGAQMDSGLGSRCHSRNWWHIIMDPNPNPERTQIYGLTVGLVSTSGFVSIRPSLTHFTLDDVAGSRTLSVCPGCPVSGSEPRPCFCTRGLLRTSCAALLLFLFAGLLLWQEPLTSAVLLCLLGAPPDSTLCWETHNVRGCCHQYPWFWNKPSLNKAAFAFSSSIRHFRGCSQCFWTRAGSLKGKPLTLFEDLLRWF